MSEYLEELDHALAAGYPVIALCGDEERRIIAGIQSRLPSGTRLLLWSCTRGFTTIDGSKAEPTTDPLQALSWVMTHARRDWILMRDFQPFLGEPHVDRAMKDCRDFLRQGGESVLLLSAAERGLPPGLRNCIHVIDVTPAGPAELTAHVQALLTELGQDSMDDTAVRDIAMTLGGLTLDQCDHILRQLAAENRLHGDGLLNALSLQRKSAAQEASFLEYVPPRPDTANFAGLFSFRQWMRERSALFSRAALSKGLPVPRGILIMGVSGCGKSLCAKALAQTWNVPLFRLDMNLVFSGLHGNPQSAFHKALKTVESMAPVVLWIDEIENGLGGLDAQTPEQSQIFSAFLTWMQEKPPLVFVAATANRIEYLPAEMIRKGRFDEVFFVDLPGEEERADLFRLHLQRHGAAPDQFKLERLVSHTEGWNGAEIAQLVESTRIHMLDSGQAFTTQDLLDGALGAVPLSQTMSEQIKALRDWAWDRAKPASADNAMVIRFDETGDPGPR